MRIAHISDTHLSACAAHPRAAQARSLWPRVLAELHKDPPDLVIHTGDLVLDDPDSTEDHRAARHAIEALPAPSLVVPGNHDVGDQTSITEERRTRYVHTWGPDRWVRRHREWRLIGINSLLLGSGLEAEQIQWAWLRDLLTAQTQPTMLFCHQPLFLASMDEPDSWAVPPRMPRRRLTELLTTSALGVGLIASGHIHRHRDITVGRLRQVTAPSTAFAVPELTTPLGAHETGYLTYSLGTAEPRIQVTRHVVSPRGR